MASEPTPWWLHSFERVKLTELRERKAVRNKDREGYKICIITVVVLNKCSLEKKSSINPVINNWLCQMHKPNAANTEWKAITVVFIQPCREQSRCYILTVPRYLNQKWACRLITAEQRRVWSDSRNCGWMKVSFLKNQKGNSNVSPTASGCGSHTVHVFKNINTNL